MIQFYNKYEIISDKSESAWVRHADHEADKAGLVAELTEYIAENKAMAAEIQLLTHKVITCGVAASHPDATLSRQRAYGGKWDSPQAQQVRTLRDRAAAAEAQVAELARRVEGFNTLIELLRTGKNGERFVCVESRSGSMVSVCDDYFHALGDGAGG